MNTRSRVLLIKKVESKILNDLEVAETLSADELESRKGGESVTKQINKALYHDNTLYAMTGL